MDVGCNLAGPAQGMPVVFVHGSTLTKQSWQPQIQGLQGEARLLSCDLPGHGAHAGQPFTMDAAVAQLKHQIERVFDLPVVLVGISLGGHVATLFSNRYPDYIIGLVLSGASMNFNGLLGQWTRLVGRIMLRMDEERLRRAAETSMRKKWPADTVQAQIAAGLFPHGAAQAFLELSKFDFCQLIGGVHAPVLILNGEFDRPNRKGEAAFAANAPHARVQVVPKAGHACNLEQPEAYTEILRCFIQELQISGVEKGFAQSKAGIRHD